MSRRAARLQLAALALATLGGCAGLEERRQEAPSATLSGPLASRTVAACVSGRWERELRARGFESPETRPLANGWVVVFNSRSHPMLGSFVDIVDTPSGSSSTVYSGRVDAAVIDLPAIVAACQKA